MRPRKGKYNPKRKLVKIYDISSQDLSVLASCIGYGGNPEHKKKPGDFGLTPPSGPRAGKSLCDAVEVFTREEALGLLKEGVKKGLISERFDGKWPKNIWSVIEKNGHQVALEAQLESTECGIYHGYPMQEDDPFSQEIIKRWNL
ncbi:MAG: hypothetical protein IV090_26445 [Candidatus Sericytochromatia bacterium]|nr:hypothetical protein [Candidatus Sericytochromatia bacterium]